MLNDMWLADTSNSEFSSFLQSESEGECVDSPAHCDTNNSSSENITCVADVAGRINDVSNSIVSETSNVKSGQIVQSSVASGNIDDCELEEDCIASEANINLTVWPMPNVLQSEHIESDIYSCAPGER